MAAKKPQAAMLLLHCKCDSCTHWEVGYDGAYYLICKTCKTKLEIYFNMEPHASLHWEKAKR